MSEAMNAREIPNQPSPLDLLQAENANLRAQLEEARGYRENAALWMADQDTRIEGLEARLAARDAEAEELRAQLQAALQRAEDLKKNQDHIHGRIQAALGNGADERAWEPGEHWLMAACRGLAALAAARDEADEMRYGLRQMLNHLTGIDHEWAKEACSIARAALADKGETC